MTTAKKTTTRKAAVHKQNDDLMVHNQIMMNMLISNGLQDALFDNSPATLGAQLSQADTLFKNNRWYLVSNMRQLLSQIYVEHGLVQTVVDLPIDDGLRGGVTITSKQLSDDQIDELQTRLERENDIGTVGQALKWNRLFGGAAVIILTEQDPLTPLEMDAISENSTLEFRAVDMWELFYDKQNTEESTSQIKLDTTPEYYNYYGQKIHKSRVMKMKGLEAPSFVRPRLRGWGFSVVESLVRSINQYLKSTDLTFEVLDEFKLDIFKIKNLSNTLVEKNGAEKIRQRTALANKQKNYQNAMTMDAEDDYVQKQLSFAGIAETMVGIRMQIASDLRMPLTKIFGISAAGFSSGEDDIENYNSMVESTVREKCKFDILRVIEMRCQQMFEFVPDDLKIKFQPLRILSAEQEENVKTQKFNRLMQARQAGFISQKKFAEGCNKENLLPVTVDEDEDSLEPTPNKEDEKSVPETKSAKSTIAAKSAPEAKE